MEGKKDLEKTSNLQETEEAKGFGIKSIEIAKLSIGPIPPPEILKGYKEIDPSFPERIFKMAEKEQRFRHISFYSGQVLGFFITIFALICSTYLGINGKEWLGGGIGLGALASIVLAYLYSQRQKTL